MKRIHSALAILLATIALSGFGLAQNGGYGMDPMAQFDALMEQMNQRVAASTEAYQQAVLDYEMFFANYYRQATGDTAAPHATAVGLGWQLYCSHYPADCQQVAAQNASWAQFRAQQHQESMGQLDASHAAWMNDQNAQHQSHQGFVQGAIHGEATYVDPWGSTISLPTYPMPGYSYTGSTGLPVEFDYQSETWWQQGYDGNWYQMEMR